MKELLMPYLAWSYFWIPKHFSFQSTRGSKLRVAICEELIKLRLGHFSIPVPMSLPMPSFIDAIYKLKVIISTLFIIMHAKCNMLELLLHSIVLPCPLKPYFLFSALYPVIRISSQQDTSIALTQNSLILVIS